MLSKLTNSNPQTGKPQTGKPHGKLEKGKSGVATPTRRGPKGMLTYDVPDADYTYKLMQQAGIPDAEIEDFLRTQKILLCSLTAAHKKAIKSFINLHLKKHKRLMQDQQPQQPQQEPQEPQEQQEQQVVMRPSILDEFVAIPHSVVECFMRMNGIMLALLNDTQKMRVLEFIRQWKMADESAKAAIIEYSMGYFHRNMKRTIKSYITPKLKKCFCNRTGKVIGAWSIKCPCRTVMVRKP